MSQWGASQSASQLVREGSTLHCLSGLIIIPDTRLPGQQPLTDSYHPHIVSYGNSSRVETSEKLKNAFGLGATYVKFFLFELFRVYVGASHALDLLATLKASHTCQQLRPGMVTQYGQSGRQPASQRSAPQLGPVNRKSNCLKTLL